MIFVVDDDVALLKGIVQGLRLEGLEVEGFRRAEEALERAASVEPQLIISDVMMPEMDGHEFKSTYSSRFRLRDTPFIFLSALDDTDNVLRGFDAGADDYLTKPFNPIVLAVKVKAFLRRSRSAPEAIFKGFLRQFTVTQLLEFCEKRGLTGQVDIEDGKTRLVLSYDAGELILEEGKAAETLVSDLLELADNTTFIIRSRPVNFVELTGDFDAPSGQVGRRPSSPPMGRLSGLQIGDRMFQIQTEYTMLPANSIETIVVVDGRVVTQRQTSPSQEITSTELTVLIDEQHSSVESLIRKRTAQLSAQQNPGNSSDENRRDDYMYEGLQRYRNGDYIGALEIFRDGLKAYPNDLLLETNYLVVQKMVGKMVKRTA